MNPYHRWLAPVLWVGVLVNFVFALGAFFAPAYMVSWFCWPSVLFPFSGEVITGRCVPWSGETVWIRDAGGLLAMLGVMYWAAANDPLRYRVNAWVFVVNKMFFAVFWVWPVAFAGAAWGFLVLGAVDFTLGLLVWIFLARLLAYERDRATPGVPAGTWS